MLLYTKFLVPRYNADNLPRPHLLEWLEGSQTKRLTLLSAPPGYGKTTLLAQLAQATHLPFAWYQLDSADSDPTIFLSYLIAAFRKMHQQFSADTTVAVVASAQALLDSVDSSPDISPRRVLTVLINDLAEVMDSAWLLILEDYHVITNPAVHNLVDYLLENGPPGLHLCLSTRSDPPLALPRLRARGQLTELRTDDLRFNQTEVKTWLERSIPGISEQSVTLLSKKTEGWGAALQIALSSLSGKDPSSANQLIANLSGTHRYIFEYLAEEVFQQHSAERQSFLLQTAILEQMDAPTCNAILKINNAQTLLEGLEQDNLFVVSLDEQRRWYRYHHLFREFLIGKLEREQPGQKPKLECIAGTIYFERNEMESAYIHYLRGAQNRKAAIALVHFAPEYIEGGRVALLQQYLGDLPPENIRNQPKLLLYYGDVLRRMGQVGPAVTRYEEALVKFKERQDPAGICRTLTQLSELAYSQGNYRQAQTLAQQAVANAGSDDYAGRATALMALAKSEGFLTGMHRGRALAEEAVSSARQAGETVSPRLRANLLRSLGQICWWHGDPQATVRYCQEALHAISEELLPITANVYIAMATPYLYWRDLDTAQKYAEKGLEIAQKLQLVELLSRAYTTLGNVLTRRGEAARAENCLRQAVELAQNLGLETFARVMASGFLAYNLCGQGRVEEARQLAETALWSQANHPDTYEMYVCRSVLADIALEGGQMVEAQQLFEGLVETGERRQFQLPLAMVYFGLAYIYLNNGQRALGLEQAKKSLTLIEPAGALQLYLDQDERARQVSEAMLAVGIKSPFIQQVLEGLPGGTSQKARVIDERVVRVQCLGQMRIFRGEEEIQPETWVSAKARDLLAYFITYRREHIPLEVILDAFWPDLGGRGKAAFHTTVSRLRQTLRQEGETAKFILAQTGEYWLDSARFQIDVDEFDAAIAKARSLSGATAAEWYERAIACYQGDYLGNLLYYDWLSPERRRLSEAYLDALQHLSAFRASNGQYTKALKLLQQLLGLDPLRETAHSEALRCYAQLGDRAGLMRQYQQLRQILNDELGVEPLPTTEALYQRLLTGEALVNRY